MALLLEADGRRRIHNETMKNNRNLIDWNAHTDE